MILALSIACAVIVFLNYIPKYTAHEKNENMKHLQVQMRFEKANLFLFLARRRHLADDLLAWPPSLRSVHLSFNGRRFYSHFRHIQSRGALHRRREFCISRLFIEKQRV